MSNFILGMIVGFLLGALILFWQQLQTLYQNRDTISGVSQIASGLNTLGVKL